MSTVLTERSTGPEQQALLRFAHLGDSASARVAEAAGDVRDWDLLLNLAARHRLGPLLYSHLNSIGWSGVPAAAETSLREQYRESARWNLFLTTHLMELIDEFEKASVRVIPYKGLVVAEAYYGSQLHRPVGDIDLVVAPEQREDAFQAARRLGYRQKNGCGYSRSLVRGSVEIDVHWRFAPSTFPLDVTFDALWGRAERVRIANREVVNLAPEDALILLSAHGTRHFWTRLIWLVDVAQLIDSRPSMNWDVVLDRASSLGCNRIVALSLFLCKRLFSMNISTGAWDLHCQDKQVLRLGAMVENQLFPPEGKPRTRSGKQFVRFAVRERLRDRIRILAAALIPHESEWQRYHLPPRLRYLVYLLRPPQLIAKYSWWALSSRANPCSPSRRSASKND